MQEFDVGDRVKITVTFTVDDIPTDVPSFTITVKDPEGIETSYNQDTPGILHSASGVYAYRIIATKYGFWDVLGKSTSEICYTASEGSFRVRYSDINK